MDINSLIFRYKNKLVSIIILVAAIIFAKNIYKKETNVITRLVEEKDSEEKKNKVLEEISSAENKFNSLKKTINNKDISIMLDTLGNLARESSVKISSLRPEAERDFSAYMLYSYSMSASADNYHKLAQFLSKLESSDDVYLIDFIELTPEDVNGEYKLRTNIRLSTIIIKNN